MNAQFFTRLCASLDLGAPVSEARRLTGGYLHSMYAVTTERGRYAIKLLNPHVMRRADAAANFERAEALEALLEERCIPILPARIFREKKMQILDGQYFYVFDFYDGSAISPQAVTPERAAQIGEALARIHLVKRMNNGFLSDEMKIDWKRYLSPLEKADEETASLLSDAIDLLEAGEKRRNHAIHRIPQSLAICHGDLDTKNVLWRDVSFRIIDLECLSMSSPFLELIEVALCWSGLDGMQIRLEPLSALVSAYAAAGGELPRDWVNVYDANWNRPYWLKYSIERILGIGSAPEEKNLGISEAQKTVRQLFLLESERQNVLDAVQAL